MSVGEVAPEGEGSDYRHRAPGTSFRDSLPFTGHGRSQSQALSVSLTHTHTHTQSAQVMDMVSQYLGHNDPWENLFLPLASAYYGVFFL